MIRYHSPVYSAVDRVLSGESFVAATAGLTPQTRGEVLKTLRYGWQLSPSSAQSTIGIPNTNLVGEPLEGLSFDQRAAVDAWFAADCQGIVNMPMGAGKTYVAIAAAARVHALHRCQVFLFVCPGPQRYGLVDEFGVELLRFGFRPVWAKDLYSTVPINIEHELCRLQRGESDHISIVASHTALLHGPLTELIDPYQESIMVVLDETGYVHIDDVCRMLPEAAPWRLGLRAGYTSLTDTLAAYFRDFVYDSVTEWERY